MPHRIAFGSCSNPSLPQPLWGIVRARRPAAFVWGGDAVYSDRHAGFNWTAVGLHRSRDHGDGSSGGGGGGWVVTFPPPSIHIEATPDVIRSRYGEQLSHEGYRRFVEGWRDSEKSRLTRPIIYGTVDDHDYGQNNGDLNYQFRRESNLAFVDFLYSGVSDKGDSCAQDADDINQRTCSSSDTNIYIEEEQDPYTRRKDRDPMHQRALKGKGVYGVQLFDFSQPRNSSWGGGFWVPVEDAMIDPDVTIRSNTDGALDEDEAKYSSTHSVAVFVLDVRSNKTPWPGGGRDAKGAPTANSNATSSAGSAVNPPALDFLGRHQWEWFRSALGNSRAAVNVIVSGLQVHPERFPNNGNIIEEWSKFPESRRMLYEAILNSGARSPLLVSGDVHMSEIMRKDCVRSSDVSDGGVGANAERRPLVEITTSGMTHSWANSFSSQPRLHRLPWKLWSYLVSPTFMTIAHWIVPLNDLIVRTAEDARKENDGSRDARGEGGGEAEIRGSLGKQYYLGLNFLELEFEFDRGEGTGDGAVTARVFGREPDAPPALEMRWTLEQLSGEDALPGTTATHGDYSKERRRHIGMHNPHMEDQWICVPHRGLPSIHHEYAANTIMFFVFCFLFFLPHGLAVSFLVAAWRSLLRRRGRA